MTVQQEPRDAVGDVKGTQMRLETQVLPQLLRRVGDKQSGRVTYAHIDEYLSSHWLKYCRTKLASMFKEADFREEGSLTARDLIATLSGRYPNRQHTADWRELVALILGVERLVLLEVDKESISEETLAVRRKHAVFSYAAWPDVEDMKPVSLNKRKGGSSCASSQYASSEWRSIAARRAAAEFGADTASTSGWTYAGGSNAGSVMTTARGLKLALETGPAQAINGAASSSAATTSRFAAAEQFRDHSQGLCMRSSVGVDSNPHAYFDAAFAAMERASGCGTARSKGLGGPQQRPGSAGARSASAGASSSTSTPRQPQQQPGGPRQQLTSRSCDGKQLFPRTAMFAPSALQQLRNNIKSCGMVQPKFQVNFKRLGCGDLEQKTCMGLKLDLSGRGVTSWP